MKYLSIATLLYLSFGSSVASSIDENLQQSSSHYQQQSRRELASVVTVDRESKINGEHKNKRVRPHKTKETSEAAAGNDNVESRANQLKKSHPSPPATGRAHGKSSKSSKSSSKSGKTSKSTKTSKSSMDAHWHQPSHHHRPTLSPAMRPPASTSPTSVSTGDTVSPTSIPPGARYYNSFESENFLEDDPRWSVETTTTTSSNNNSNNNNNGGDRNNGGRNSGRNGGRKNGGTSRGKRRTLLETIMKKDTVSGKFRGKKCRQDQDDPTRNCRGDRLRAKKEQQQRKKEDEENKASSDSQYWASTTKESNTGIYSIKTPNLSDLSDDPNSRSANVTLTTDKSWGEGTLVFHLLWNLTTATAPTDSANLLWYVDDKLIGSLGSSSSSDGEWERFEISLDGEESEHEVTWEYKYEPSGEVLNNRMEEEEGGGVVHMDDVYFTNDSTSPTLSPNFNIPTAPTYTPTYFPTGLNDTTSMPTTATTTTTNAPTFPIVTTAAPTLEPATEAPTVSPTSRTTG